MESVPTSAEQEGLKNGLKITRVVKQLYKDKQSNLNYKLIYMPLLMYLKGIL